MVPDVRADVLFGQCAPEGVRISTSWNSRVAYCRDGKYEITFDGRVDSTITVYVSGNRYGRVYVNRATEYHIDARRRKR